MKIRSSFSALPSSLAEELSSMRRSSTRNVCVCEKKPEKSFTNNYAEKMAGYAEHWQPSFDACLAPAGSPARRTHRPAPLARSRRPRPRLRTDQRGQLAPTMGASLQFASLRLSNAGTPLSMQVGPPSPIRCARHHRSLGGSLFRDGAATPRIRRALPRERGSASGPRRRCVRVAPQIARRLAGRTTRRR